MLENFLDTNPEEVNSDEPWSSDDQPTSAPRKALTDERGHYPVSFLIATLPESGPPPLRSVFDTDLGAISLALGRARYALASFDLPWLDDAESDAQDFRLGQTIDLTLLGLTTPIVTITPEDEHRAEHEPGVMLFHREKPDDPKKDDQASLLVLFLVGESPTRGVNQTALRDALDQIAWLSGKKPGNPLAPPHLVALTGKGEAPDEIKIIGPSFSGSAVSLRDTLEEWGSSLTLPANDCPPHKKGTSNHHKKRKSPSSPCPCKKIGDSWKPTVNIISGSATAIGHHELKLAPGELEVKYSSLRVSDATMLQSIARRFRRHHHGRQIVMLAENTSYGTAGMRAVDEATRRGFLTIRFPLHISDLRTAFSNGAAGSSALESPIAAHNLPLPEEAGQQEGDVVPAFSERSRVYEELILQSAFQQIRAEGARYVGVVATDVEDLIFLVRELRANCPDVVIFTTSSDLLFTHSGFGPDLTGLLVFSSFPLFGPVQAWTNTDEADRRRVQFPSEAAEGFYDATLAQLDQQQWMLDYALPFGEPSSPVLWLSVVGRGSLWPIFEPESPKGAPDAFRATVAGPPAPPNLNELYPRSFLFASLLLIALCFIPCVAFLWFTKRPRLIGQSVFKDLKDDHDGCVIAFIGVLLIASLLWLSFYLLPLWATLGWYASWGTLQWPVIIIAGLGIVTTVVVIAAFFGALFCAVPSSWTGSHPRWKWIRGRSYVEPVDPKAVPGVNRGDYPVHPTGAQNRFFFSGTILGLVLVGVLIYTNWWNSPAEALLCFQRSVNLGNRVSPLMPLIFLGVANLCLLGGFLRWLQLLEDWRVALPFLNFDAVDSFSGVSKLEREVVEKLECRQSMLPGWRWLLILLALVLVYFLCSEPGSVFHMDGWAFELLFLLLAATVYYFFSILLLRFVAVWRALHPLLRRLYWHPSRNAYKELRETLPGDSEDQHIRLFEPQPTLTAAEYCLERAREIRDILETHPAKSPRRILITGLIAESEKHLNKAEDADDDHTERLLEQIRASRELAGLSAEIVRLVEPEWRLNNRQEPELLKDEDEEKLMKAARLFVASRVVDFLRRVFPQLRNLAVVAMAGVLAMMLASSVYPFVQRDTIVWLSWLVLLSTIGVGFTVFIQINRSRLVSMLMGTSPGRYWNSSFSIQLLIYGVLPILVLLGAQFPHVFGGVFSWVSSLFGGAKQ